MQDGRQGHAEQRLNKASDRCKARDCGKGKMSNKDGEKGLVLTGGLPLYEFDAPLNWWARKHGVHAQVRGGHSTIPMQSPNPSKKYFYFFDFSTPFDFQS